MFLNFVREHLKSGQVRCQVDLPLGVMIPSKLLDLEIAHADIPKQLSNYFERECGVWEFFIPG
jgi:hypothetical protein